MANTGFSNNDENSYYFARSNADERFGTHADRCFLLEGKTWPTIEHYFQAMKFSDETYQEKIRAAITPQKARKLGRTRFKRIQKNWGEIRSIIMTRAMYTLCHSYPDVAAELLASGDTRLVENSMYDYYWGCGRDRLGTNMYGQVLMNVRDKLRAELPDLPD